ncbi:hypothetical protein D3C84_1078380 [compost metagenome]
MAQTLQERPQTDLSGAEQEESREREIRRQRKTEAGAKGALANDVDRLGEIAAPR